MKLSMNSVISTITVLALVITAGCSKDEQTIVKEARLDFDKSTTIGMALDGYKYFAKKDWQTVKTPQGGRIVILKTEMSPDFVKEANEACRKTDPQHKSMDSQKWSIQFTINKDDTVHISGTQTLTNLPEKKYSTGSLNEALLQSVFKNQLAPVCE